MAPKVFSVPHLSAAFALRGVSSMLLAVSLRLCDTFQSFDAMAEGAGDMLAGMFQPLPKPYPVEANTDLVLAGWSERRKRPEAYAAYSYDANGTGAPAFTVVPLEPGMIAPHVPVDDLDMDSGDFLHAVAKRQEAAHPGAIGGFWQETTIWRDRIETRILERWERAEGLLFV